MKAKYEDWCVEYEPNEMEDEEPIFGLKKAISALNSVQRKIFLTYVDLGSFAATAREFGVCTATAKKYIKEIKRILYAELNMD